ncbi:ATPase [Nocardiopsis gilva YIM 90087]|uniref:ATPase n=1 Tax=Nocardiopsis gilva YIM 90087 TaxID=1235441 RepID=A0A223S3W8_9ACTN|nr:SRPBCC family protein [Nocardiopsis gilva]ASU82822.1 ATPase [Nocardiopsis gilva YIM 90087]
MADKTNTTDKTELIVEPGHHDIVVTRVFDSPRDVVYQAFTDPDLIPKWWGPAQYETTVDRAEVRPGGVWRYISRDENGTEYAFKGVYHDLVAPESIVSTFEFEGVPGHVELDTATFEEIDGGKRTKYTSVSVFQSVEDRDAMVASGMESGLRETLNRFADIVERAGADH